jgi:hypothetical protein
MADLQNGFVAVDIDGHSHRAQYQVDSDILTVAGDLGVRSCRIGDLPVHPELIARHLLMQLIDELYVEDRGLRALDRRDLLKGVH